MSSEQEQSVTTTPAYLDNTMRRTDLAWNDWPAVEAFLKDQLVCRVAINDQPSPYVVAQSYRFRGDAFLVHCSRFGKLAGLLARDQQITIEVDQLVALLKAPKGQNTSFEYYSVIARCTVELDDGLEEVRAHQYEVLGKYRPENDYTPIDNFAPMQIIAITCRIDSMSAKKRILADGQYSPPGQPQAPYIRYPLPHSGVISALPPEAFDARRFADKAGG